MIPFKFHTFRLSGGRQIKCGAWDPLGRFVAVGTGRAIVLLDPRRRMEEVRELPEDGTVNSLTFSPCGKLLLALKDGNKVARVWHLGAGPLAPAGGPGAPLAPGARAWPPHFVELRGHGSPITCGDFVRVKPSELAPEGIIAAVGCRDSRTLNACTTLTRPWRVGGPSKHPGTPARRPTKSRACAASPLTAR